MSDAQTPVVPDQQAREEWEALGYYTVLYDDDAPDAALTDRSDVILLSSSASSAKLGERFRFTGKPVLVLNSAQLPALGLTGQREEDDWGVAVDGEYIELLGVGSAGDAAGSGCSIAVNREAGSYPFGVPALSAEVIAQLVDEPARAVIFAYQPDTELADGTFAQGLRIAWFEQTGRAADRTAIGQRLFEKLAGVLFGEPIANLRDITDLGLEGADADDDGRIDRCDADDDNDGVIDASDLFPFDPAESVDTDSDGIGNNADDDDDNDGLEDQYEAEHGLVAVDAMDALADADADGFSNLAEFRAGSDPNSPDSSPSEAVETQILASVLPTSRSARIDQTVTAFATIINTGVDRSNCAFVPDRTLPGEFSFATTNPLTNSVDGARNQGVDLPAGGAQSFVFSITPRAAFPPKTISFRFACEGSDQARSITGLNTLLLSASPDAVADVIALVATPSADGIVNLAGSAGSGVFLAGIDQSRHRQ